MDAIIRTGPKRTTREAPTFEYKKNQQTTSVHPDK